MNSPTWRTHAAHVTQCVCTAAHRHGPREASLQREMSHGGEIPRALVFLQNRPRTPPESQLSTNAISPSLKPSHLTPWPSWNSPARTPGDSAHDSTAMVTQRGHASPLGPAATLLMGRSPSPTQAAMLSDGVGWHDLLGKATAAHSHP